MKKLDQTFRFQSHSTINPYIMMISLIVIYLLIIYHFIRLLYYVQFIIFLYAQGFLLLRFLKLSIMFYLRQSIYFTFFMFDNLDSFKVLFQGQYQQNLNQLTNSFFQIYYYLKKSWQFLILTYSDLSTNSNNRDHLNFFFLKNYLAPKN